MPTEIRHISDFLNHWAPPATQLDFDNVGLLVGDSSKPVSSIITCLDVTEAVVDEAIEQNAELIVAHHPIIFRKMSRITPTSEQGRIIYKAIRHDIGIFASHTNLDAAKDGVSYLLAKKIGLTNIGLLQKNYQTLKNVRLAFPHFSSDANAEKVATLLTEFAYRPPNHYEDTGSTPLTIFELLIDEFRISELKGVLASEGLNDRVSIDIFNIEQPSDQYGMGAIGRLSDPVDQETFLGHLCDLFDTDAIRFSGSSENIRTVAVCGGAGVSLTAAAKRAGADAFVTADIKYHEYFTDTDSFLLIDIGHYESEIHIAEALQTELNHQFPDVTVAVTRHRTNPMHIHTRLDQKQTTE